MRALTREPSPLRRHVGLGQSQCNEEPQQSASSSFSSDSTLITEARRARGIPSSQPTGIPVKGMNPMKGWYTRKSMRPPNHEDLVQGSDNAAPARLGNHKRKLDCLGDEQKSDAHDSRDTVANTDTISTRPYTWNSNLGGRGNGDRPSDKSILEGIASDEDHKATSSSLPVFPGDRPSKPTPPPSPAPNARISEINRNSASFKLKSPMFLPLEAVLARTSSIFIVPAENNRTKRTLEIGPSRKELRKRRRLRSKISNLENELSKARHDLAEQLQPARPIDVLCSPLASIDNDTTVDWRSRFRRKQRDFDNIPVPSTDQVCGVRPKRVQSGNGDPAFPSSSPQAVAPNSSQPAPAPTTYRSDAQSSCDRDSSLVSPGMELMQSRYNPPHEIRPMGLRSSPTFKSPRHSRAGHEAGQSSWSTQETGAPNLRARQPAKRVPQAAEQQAQPYTIEEIVTVDPYRDGGGIPPVPPVPAGIKGKRAKIWIREPSKTEYEKHHLITTEEQWVGWDNDVF